MTGGLTALRWAIATQWWHRRRRIGDMSSRLVGLPDAPGADPTSELEGALGSDEGLTVVVADRGEGVARSLHRAMGLMLGDLSFVRLTEPHAVDLADVLALSRRPPSRRRLVLFVDDAPPALLDQFGAATRALLDAQVRCVVVARASSLDAYLPDAATTVLRAASRAIVARTSDATVTPPTDRLERAVVDAVTDWDRLALGPALTPEMLGRFVRVYLPAREPVTSWKDLRRAVRRCVREGHVLRTRRRAEEHLAPVRVWSVVADGEGPLGRAVPEEMARALREHLTVADRVLAARVALARAERDVAMWLLSNLPAESVSPAVAEQMGSTLAARAIVQARALPWDLPTDPAGPPAPLRTAAIRWLRSAAERGDPELSRRATRSAGLVAYEAGELDTARTLLLTVAEDDTDRQVQVVLAELTSHDPDGRVEARRRLELVLAGGEEDDLAARAAARLAETAIEEERPEDAVPLLVVAARAADPADRHAARLRRIHVLRDLGRHDEEERVVAELQEKLGPDAPADRRQDVALEVAVVRRRHDDLDGAATALGEAVRSGGPAGLQAGVELAELELSRQRWTEALAATTSVADYRVGTGAPEDLVARRDAAEGEAAFQLGDMDSAQDAFSRRTGDAHALLRLGQIALERGQVLEAYRRFHTVGQVAPGSADAALAAELAAPIRTQANQIATAEQAAAAERSTMIDVDVMPA